MGLSITKRLIDALGGAIQIESWPNRGSRVTIRIPSGPLTKQAPIVVCEKPQAPATDVTLPLEGRALLDEDGPDNHA